MLIVRENEKTSNLGVEEHCSDTSKMLLEARKRFQKESLKFIGLSRPVAASVSRTCVSCMS